MRLPTYIIIAAGMIAFSIMGCGPYGGYGYDYPEYGYAPYSWGVGNYWGYHPDIAVEHPWENHWRYPDHHNTYHSPVGGFHSSPAPIHGGAGFHGDGGFHGGGGGSHGGGPR
jgi:hypothetical protein